MQVFFYGLFMDEAILEKNGIQPSDPRLGYLDNYTLKIGNRASLIPSEGDQAWGLLMKVNPDAIQGLYAEPSVADYIPEEVIIHTASGESVEAFCYNLPLELLSGEPNTGYASALYDLGKVKGLPADYLARIREMF